MRLAQPASRALEVAPARFWARVGTELGWVPVLGGLAASIAMAVSGSAILVAYDGAPVRWWFGAYIPPRTGEIGNYLICYAGMIGLSAAWFAVLRRLRRSSSLRTWELLAVAGAWAVPLVLGPPLFSRDVYSYLAQGMLAHIHLSPYQYPPAVLGVVGFGNVLSAVSPVWRSTTAPYGPVFMWLAGAVAAISGGQLAIGALLLRLPELVGVGLSAITLPKLARSLGADPREALWLGAASPLVLFELLSSGHNDALMVGLLMLGLLMAVQHRPFAGVALCSLGTLVKLPALIGAVFIAWAWAREREGFRPRVLALSIAGTVSLVTLIAGSAVTDGFGWVSSKLLSVPNKVAIPISPSKAVSSAVQFVAGAVGVSAKGHFVPDLVRDAGLALGALVILLVLSRVYRDTLVPCLGVAMVVVVLLGTDAWPWYLTWGVLPLAAWRPAQRSWLLIGAVALFDFVVTPAGQLVFPNSSAPFVALAWALLALAFWVTHRRSWPSWALPAP